jgi:hypothetical protein
LATSWLLLILFVTRTFSLFGVVVAVSLAFAVIVHAILFAIIVTVVTTTATSTSSVVVVVTIPTVAILVVSTTTSLGGLVVLLLELVVLFFLDSLFLLELSLLLLGLHPSDRSICHHIHNEHFDTI